MRTQLVAREAWSAPLPCTMRRSKDLVAVRHPSLQLQTRTKGMLDMTPPIRQPATPLLQRTQMRQSRQAAGLKKAPSRAHPMRLRVVSNFLKRVQHQRGWPTGHDANLSIRYRLGNALPLHLGQSQLSPSQCPLSAPAGSG